MTFTDEYIPVEETSAGGAAGGISAFGITLSPLVGGVALGVLGILAGAWLYFNQVQPVRDQSPAGA